MLIEKFGEAYREYMKKTKKLRFASSSVMFFNDPINTPDNIVMNFVYKTNYK